ncbi:hypothetical protein FHT87_001857 [Rhizobium sp. BK316]|uniref:histidine kinase n=1 Tax=Rhizobium sp. BK316 TaxID=2587053 RepID=UPI00161EE14E|nr:histidine kinase [Rhizobium sp. BK316]MBB3407954.1 hypothetical protein [Rhizobium sp. BK316]
MKKLIIAAAFAAFLPVMAQAETLEFPSDDPVASVTIPDSWGPKETETGIDAQSEDSAIYLSIDVADEATSDKIIDEAFAFLQKNGVSIEEKTQKESEAEINGMTMKTFDWDGSDKEGPVNIGVAVLSPSEGKLLLITYWGTKGKQDAHDDELIAIISSLKPTG